MLKVYKRLNKEFFSDLQLYRDFDEFRDIIISTPEVFSIKSIDDADEENFTFALKSGNKQIRDDLFNKFVTDVNYRYQKNIFYKTFNMFRTEISQRV